MLTDRMTMDEMYREMMEDNKEVMDKMFSQYRLNQLKRMSMTHKNSEVRTHFFVNTSRKNRYACIISVDGWREFCKAEVHRYTIGIYDTDKGKYAVTISTMTYLDKTYSTINRYQPHFFSRYAERMGVSLTGEDLIMHFLSRNNMACIQNDPLKRNETEVFAATAEGLSLGYREGCDIKFNTFIPYDGLGKTKYEISQEQVRLLKDMVTAKYGSFIKSKDKERFYTTSDLILDIIESNMADDEVRPSQRNQRSLYGDHRNAVFELSMRERFQKAKNQR